MTTPTDPASEERAAQLVRAATVLRFLNGEGPLDGQWFGDQIGGRAFWWRKHLRDIEDALINTPRNQHRKGGDHE